jgi:hypothetical protein
MCLVDQCVNLLNGMGEQWWYVRKCVCVCVFVREGYSICLWSCVCLASRLFGVWPVQVGGGEKALSKLTCTVDGVCASRAGGAG